MNKYQEALDEIGDDLKFLGEGGVLESTDWDNLQELVDRATPMKVKVEKWDNSITLEDTRERCPTCNTILFTTEAPYCPYCGQALDWGDK